MFARVAVVWRPLPQLISPPIYIFTSYWGFQKVTLLWGWRKSLFEIHTQECTYTASSESTVNHDYIHTTNTEHQCVILPTLLLNILNSHQNSVSIRNNFFLLETERGKDNLEEFPTQPLMGRRPYSGPTCTRVQLPKAAATQVVLENTAHRSNIQ